MLHAIALCDRHPEALRYRETAFDAYYFLGRICTMAGEYVKAEEAYNEAERRLRGTFFDFPLPLCPAEVREKAARERNSRS